jgi:secretion/DNA translocation related TadE-like protein
MRRGFPRCRSSASWPATWEEVVARRRGPAHDRGSATVWSVGAIAVLCVVFGVVLALGQAVVVRHRAAGGADLAALAAADHWSDGPGEACARAEGVARAQGARLVRCALVGEISDVTAASGRGPFTAEVRARAGPAGPVPSGVPLPPGDGALPPDDPAVPEAPASAAG